MGCAGLSSRISLLPNPSAEPNAAGDSKLGGSAAKAMHFNLITAILAGTENMPD